MKSNGVCGEEMPPKMQWEIMMIEEKKSEVSMFQFLFIEGKNFITLWHMVRVLSSEQHWLSFEWMHFFCSPYKSLDQKHHYVLVGHFF